jgi:hypothetical protein
VRKRPKPIVKTDRAIEQTQHRDALRANALHQQRENIDVTNNAMK